MIKLWSHAWDTQIRIWLDSRRLFFPLFFVPTTRYEFADMHYQEINLIWSFYLNFYQTRWPSCHLIRILWMSHSRTLTSLHVEEADLSYCLWPNASCGSRKMRIGQRRLLERNQRRSNFHCLLSSVSHLSSLHGYISIYIITHALESKPIPGLLILRTMIWTAAGAHQASLVMASSALVSLWSWLWLMMNCLLAHSGGSGSATDLDECKEGIACHCDGCTCKNKWGGFDCTCRGNQLYLRGADTCIGECAGRMNFF